jgi:putative membrane protein insertion efficiency factor
MTEATSRSGAVLLRSINLYQRLMQHRQSPCRYTPSCSEYAREAIEVHGAGRGSWLAVRRLSHCHPLGGHGFDPVPEPLAHPSAQRTSGAPR